jgi:ribosome maturation factor RimP
VVIEVPEISFRSSIPVQEFWKGSVYGAFLLLTEKLWQSKEASLLRRDLTHLWELFEPVVNGMGFDLIEIEHFPNPKHGVLRLYIDKPEGVVIEDCSEVSRQISALIDVEEPVSGQFNLEVSSPGLDRPLRRLKDFQRFVGSQVKLKTMRPLDGQRNFKGRLLQADEDVLVIETDAEELSLPMNAIEKARIVPEF